MPRTGSASESAGVAGWLAETGGASLMGIGASFLAVEKFENPPARVKKPTPPVPHAPEQEKADAVPAVELAGVHTELDVDRVGRHGFVLSISPAANAPGRRG